MVDQNNISTQDKRVNTWVKMAALALVLPVLVWVPQDAKASPAAGVDSPSVERGVTALEFSGGRYFDHRDSIDREREWDIAIGHGFTDYWLSKVEGAWENAADDHEGTHYSGFSWINIFQLGENGEQIVDFGVYTELAFPDTHEEANEFAIGPMMEKQFGATVYNLNLIWVRDYNHQADEITTFEYNFQARVTGDPMLEYGLQIFGDMGEWGDMHSFNDQEHKIGPAIFGETATGTKSKLVYDGALLFGITDEAADATLRFTLAYEMD